MDTSSRMHTHIRKSLKGIHLKDLTVDSPRHKGFQCLHSDKCSVGGVWGYAGSCAVVGTIPSAFLAPLLPGMVLEGQG